MVNKNFECIIHSGVSQKNNVMTLTIHALQKVFNEYDIQSLKNNFKNFIDIDQNEKNSRFNEFAKDVGLELFIDFSATDFNFNQAIEAINDAHNLCGLVNCVNEYFMEDFFQNVRRCCVHRCYTKSTIYCENEGSCIVDYDANYKPNCKYVFRN